MGKAIDTSRDNLGYFNPPNVYRPAIIDIRLVGEYSAEDGATNTYRITQNDGKIFEFDVKNGSGGSAGRSVTSVEQIQISTESLGKNVARIKLSDGTYTDVEIRNGAQGEVGPQGERGPAGIDQVEASIGTNDPTQAPSVDKDLTEGVLSLTFNNIKGEKGDQGEPAVAVENYLTAEATSSTTSATDVLPATGSSDTVYRVSNWDGTQYNTNAYTEYGWYDGAYKMLATRTPGIDDEPTANSQNLVKSGGVASQISQLGQKANFLTLNRTGDNVFDENYIRKDKIVRSSSPYDVFDYANAYLTKYYRIPSTCKKIVVSGLYGDSGMVCRFSKEPTDNSEAVVRSLSETGDSVEIVMTPELFAYPYVCFMVSRGTASPVFTNATITFGNQIDEKLLPILGSDAEVVSFPNVGYIAWSTGVVQSSGYHSTELIPVYAGDVITMSGMSGSDSVAGLAAYDENGDYLQSLSMQGATSAEREYIVPVGVSFVRLCTYDDTLNTANVSVKYNPMFVKAENVTDSKDASDEKIPTLGVVKEIKKELSVGFSYDNSILTSQGYLMYTNTGNILTHSDFDCGEEYYPVTPGQRWKCLFNAQGTAGVCFYDTSKTYINQYWQSDGAKSMEFVVPENAAFARFCNRHTVVANPTFKLIQEEYDDLQTLTEEIQKLKTAQSNDKYKKGIIRLYPKTKLPCVSFQFDDLHYKDELLVSLFESYNLTCAFAFIASTSNITNKAETYKGYQKRGFQIMNHSVDGTIFNPTNYTYETALETIRTALYRIENAGMVCDGFVSPSSSMASEFMPILGMFQSYAFTSATTSPTANGRNQDRCDLHRYSLESHTIAEIKQYIDDCITNDQIMTFYGHAANLVDGGDASVFSLAKIAAVIEYCITKRNAGTLYVGGTDDCVKYFFDL